MIHILTKDFNGFNDRWLVHALVNLSEETVEKLQSLKEFFNEMQKLFPTLRNIVVEEGSVSFFDYPQDYVRELIGKEALDKLDAHGFVMLDQSKVDITEFNDGDNQTKLPVLVACNDSFYMKALSENTSRSSYRTAHIPYSVLNH